MHHPQPVSSKVLGLAIIISSSSSLILTALLLLLLLSLPCDLPLVFFIDPRLQLMRYDSPTIRVIIVRPTTITTTEISHLSSAGDLKLLLLEEVNHSQTEYRQNHRYSEKVLGAPAQSELKYKAG
jgi:hypothetical protein